MSRLFSSKHYYLIALVLAEVVPLGASLTYGCTVLSSSLFSVVVSIPSGSGAVDSRGPVDYNCSTTAGTEPLDV